MQRQDSSTHECSPGQNKHVTAAMALLMAVHCIRATEPYQAPSAKDCIVKHVCLDRSICVTTLSCWALLKYSTGMREHAVQQRSSQGKGLQGTLTISHATSMETMVVQSTTIIGSLIF